MSLRRGSKLLSTANEDNYYVMIYHDTPVLYWDKINGIVTFKHNGWKTRATASAMNLALEDIGLPYKCIYYSKDELYFGEGKTVKLENGHTFKYTGWNESDIPKAS